MAIFDKIFRGTIANDSTGDPLRTGGQIINDNFEKAVSRINSVDDIHGLTPDYDGQVVTLTGWHPDTIVGGGQLVWDANGSKSDHNGGTVFSPTVPAPSEQASIGDYLDGVGETDPSGQGVYRRRDVEYVTVFDFGAKGDESTNDTHSFFSALLSHDEVFVPDGFNFIVSDLVISQDYRTLRIGNSSKIVIPNSGGSVGISIAGSFCKVTGGQISTDVSASKTWIISMDGFGSELIGVTVNDPTKSQYMGDGINIPYNRGCVRVNAPNCLIESCNIYNAEGAGVWNYRENTRILGNRVHDNITGVVLDYGGSLGFGDNVVVSDNIILNNNAGSTLHMSGADGILSVKTTKGHTINGNQIGNNGEHGTYIQSTATTVTANTAFDNPGSGIKFGGGYNSTCQGNIGYGNCSGINPGTDDADFYFQSPMGNLTISGNKSTNSASFGIRVVWLENKAVSGDEARISINGNTVTGSVNDAIRASSNDGLSISGNVTDGTITIGQSSLNYPTTINAVVSANVANTIIVDKSSETLVRGNVIETLNINTSAIGAVIDNNKINAQTTRIPLQSIKEFNHNRINYPETTLTEALFEQGGNVASNSKKRFIGNVFNSGGARFIYFTSQGISGNDNSWINNELNGGVSQSIYTWGDNHQFIGNRETGDGDSLCYLRGTNCIITNNIGVIATENPGTNIISNNLVRV